MEVGKPDFLEHVLDLLSFVVLHHVCDEAGVLLDIADVVEIGDAGIQKLAEVVTNRKINKDLLVKGGIIVSFDSLDILQLWEVAEGIETLKQ